AGTPNATGLRESTLTLRSERGTKNSDEPDVRTPPAASGSPQRPPRAGLTVFAATFNRAIANSHTPFRKIRVPPASANSLSANAPVVPRPPTYSVGIDPARFAFSMLLAGWSGITIVSNLERSPPA